MLDSLFSPITINKRQLKNRCIVPAMVMNLCEEDGSCTERFAAYHEAKAKGGFAMIIMTVLRERIRQTKSLSHLKI